MPGSVAHAPAPRARLARACDRDQRQSGRGTDRPGTGRVSSTETVHGIHAVQALLERHPQRVLRLRAWRRARRCAHRRGCWRSPRPPASRGSSASTRRSWRDKLAGDVAHQGVLAEVRRAAPGARTQLFAALGRREHAAAARARWRAGPAQPRRLPAHRRCLRGARGDRAARPRRAAQRHGPQGRRRRGGDYTGGRRDQPVAHACDCSRKPGSGSSAPTPPRARTPMRRPEGSAGARDGLRGQRPAPADPPALRPAGAPAAARRGREPERLGRRRNAAVRGGPPAARAGPAGRTPASR